MFFTVYEYSIHIYSLRVVLIMNMLLIYDKILNTDQYGEPLIITNPEWP